MQEVFNSLNKLLKRDDMKDCHILRVWILEKEKFGTAYIQRKNEHPMIWEYDKNEKEWK